MQELARQAGAKAERSRFAPPQLESLCGGPGRTTGAAQEITGQHYLDTFGFRGGEFGNWIEPE